MGLNERQMDQGVDTWQQIADIVLWYMVNGEHFVRYIDWNMPWIAAK